MFLLILYIHAFLEKTFYFCVDIHMYVKDAKFQYFCPSLSVHVRHTEKTGSEWKRYCTFIALQYLLKKKNTGFVHV